MNRLGRIGLLFIKRYCRILFLHNKYTLPPVKSSFSHRTRKLPPLQLWQFKELTEDISFTKQHFAKKEKKRKEEKKSNLRSCALQSTKWSHQARRDDGIQSVKHHRGLTRSFPWSSTVLEFSPYEFTIYCNSGEARVSRCCTISDALRHGCE